jgi:hypothetical protein
MSGDPEQRFHREVREPEQGGLAAPISAPPCPRRRSRRGASKSTTLAAGRDPQPGVQLGETHTWGGAFEQELSYLRALLDGA